MECQHVQQLLAFVDRKCEELDASDRDAVRHHLENCPTCAELAQAERHADDTLGALLRDVPVPADLKQKVMNRLAAERGGVPWKSGLAAAAVILLAVMGGLAWYNRAHPEVKPADLERIAMRGAMDAVDVERYLSAEKGLVVKVPRELFDFRYFQNVDVVDEFNGQRVAKLTFARLEDGHITTASVLILSPEQFRMKELKDRLTIPGTTSIRVHHEQDFVNVIFHTGNLSWLQPQLQ
jgi:hypothetical protein